MGRRVASLEIKDRAFPSDRHFQPWVGGLGHAEQTVELVILVGRIVVEGHEVPHVGEFRKRERVIDGAVAPSNVVVILDAAVLGVMDEQVHAFSERVAGGPLGRLRETPRAERRFVIRQVGKRVSPGGDPVADGEAGVTDPCRGDTEFSEVEVPDGQLMEDQSRDVSHMHGEERRGKIPSETGA